MFCQLALRFQTELAASSIDVVSFFNAQRGCCAFGQQRVAQMRAVVEHLPPSNYSESSTKFANIQSEVRRLTARPASADGPPTLKRSDPR